MTSAETTSRAHRHGRRISAAEYDHRMVRLHSCRSGTLTQDEDERLRRAELDITIDHRLGVDFPLTRRELLWRAQEEIERSRLRKWWLLLIAPALRPSSGLARVVLRAYSKVLDEDELVAFFGEEQQ